MFLYTIQIENYVSEYDKERNNAFLKIFLQEFEIKKWFFL